MAAPNVGDGVFLRASLNPRRSYRLTIDPVAGPGGFAMRLRLGPDGRYEYLSAPSINTDYDIAGSAVEILFYRAAPTESTEYLLKRATVTICANCQTDGGLRREVLAQAPGLRAALREGNTLSAAVDIMHWAAPRVPFTGSDGQMVADYWQRSATDLLNLYYLSHRKGGDCGPDADLVLKLMQLFGLHGFLIDFGDRSWLTHVVLGVPVDKPGGGTEQFVLDPTFDGLWVWSADGRPVSLLTALALVRHGQGARVGLSTSSLGERWVLPGATSAVALTRPETCRQIDFRAGGCGLAGFMNAEGYAARFDAHALAPDAFGFVSLLSESQIFAAAASGVPASVLAAYRRLRLGQASSVSPVRAS